MKKFNPGNIEIESCASIEVVRSVLTTDDYTLFVGLDVRLITSLQSLWLMMEEALI